MPEESEELFDIDESISRDIESGESASEKGVIEIRDASTEVAKVLVPEFGSDDNFTREGKIDTRRFGNIQELDVWWLSWFDIIPKEYGGGYAQQYCDSYRNHRYGVNGEHKKLSIGMTGAVSGQNKQTKESAKRSLLDKVLGRNKEENELFDVS